MKWDNHRRSSVTSAVMKTQSVVVKKEQSFSITNKQFLHRISELFLGDMERSSVIQEGM